MWEDRDRLDLDHKTDQRGKMIPNEYNGMAHRNCNQAANAFGKNKRPVRAQPDVPVPTGRSVGRVWLARVVDVGTAPWDGVDEFGVVA